MFKFLCEEKIPFAREAFSNLGVVTLCKGNRLTAEDLKCVDVLMIRSGTVVDHRLLAGTPVQFVASPTAGTDHIDKAYLKRRKIAFYNAPGCNAESVVEYVLAGLLHLAEKKSRPLTGQTVGIVGVGNVGGRLALRLAALGMHVLIHDPPRLESGADMGEFEHVSLGELLDASDIISLHTPLTRDGRYPTYHLIDEKVLMRMRPQAWLVNASRGAVVSNPALKKVLKKGHLGGVVLDVWENEPAIDVDLLQLVDIGTAHIAGYSYDGKVNGTIQVYEAFTGHYNVEGGWDPNSILEPNAEDHVELRAGQSGEADESLLRQLVAQMYDILEDDALFRTSIDLPPQQRADHFLHLRKSYARRRSFHWHKVAAHPAWSVEGRQYIERTLRVGVV